MESIQPGLRPSPFFAIWGRGGAKTTSAEAAAVRLGARGIRKFCLYVRGTQDKANESVQSIAAMLESPKIARHYPQLAERKLGKYGNSKGWRVETLRCANDFNVIGLGLDASVRGIKIEGYRPDLIILDDLDSQDDSLETIRKKIVTLTTAILPAGSNDVAIIGIQNLIHPNSIFSQINDGRAEFLYDRVISGPYKAVEGLTYSQRQAPERGYDITGGAATWQGQDLATCEKQINTWGLTAFLQEAQHEIEDPPGGMYSHLEYRHCTWADVPQLDKITIWLDPAVTDTDQSDSQGIQADGIASELIYRLYSWEGRAGPDDAIRRAILKAVELGADSIGFETDQGGDLWESSYNHIWHDMANSPDYPQITPDTPQPYFESDRAGSIGSKVHRGQLQLAEYEKGRFIHVLGTHTVLERALRRFPRTKPFDLHDAAFWSQNYLIEGGGISVGLAMPGQQ